MTRITRKNEAKDSCTWGAFFLFLTSGCMGKSTMQGTLDDKMVAKRSDLIKFNDRLLWFLICPNLH